MFAKIAFYYIEKSKYLSYVQFQTCVDKLNLDAIENSEPGDGQFCNSLLTRLCPSKLSFDSCYNYWILILFYLIV